MIDQVDSIITAYSSLFIESRTTYDLSTAKRSAGAGKLLFDLIQFEKNPVPFGEKIKIAIKLKSQGSGPHKNLDLAININNNYNECIIHSCNRFTNTFFDHLDDDVIYQFEIDNILKPGHYSIAVFLRTNDVIQDWLQNIATMEILDGNPYNFSDSSQIQGVIFPTFKISSVNVNKL
jgi:hypothetical protein